MEGGSNRVACHSLSARILFQTITVAQPMVHAFFAMQSVAISDTSWRLNGVREAFSAAGIWVAGVGAAAAHHRADAARGHGPAVRRSGGARFFARETESTIVALRFLFPPHS